MKWFTIFIILFLVNMEIFAQCPMCRIAVENNLNAGGEIARGLNRGILYMFAAPYIIVGTIAYLFIRNKRMSAQE